MKNLAKIMGWNNQPKKQSLAIDNSQSAANDGSYSSTEKEGMGDEDILQKLFSASNGLDILKLFNGDTSMHNDDHSAADLALVNSIAFYTQHPEQIDSIFRHSKLMREKWDEPHSSTGERYGEITINKALADLDATYIGPSQKKNQSKAFEFVNGKQLLERPMKTDWLVKDYIPTDATVMLFGAPASGKSLIALDIASCVISGEDWHGQPVKKGKVAYIAGEGFNGISKRFQALVKDKKIPVENFNCSKIAMDLLDDESTKSVLSSIKSMKNLHLIIIDTLHRNFSGDENLSSNFAIALKHCDMLRNATGATIMLVHHSGHKSADRGRGSSSMTGAMDAEFKVSKAKNAVTLNCTKMKDDEEPKDKAFSLESFEIGTDENGEAITAPILKKLTISKMFKSVTPLTKTDKLVFDLLSQLSTTANNPVSKEGWKSACVEKITVKEDSVDPQGTKSKQFSRSVTKLLKMDKILEEDGYFIIAEPQTSIETEDDN